MASPILSGLLIDAATTQSASWGTAIGDLAPDLLPGAFAAFGKSGVAGLMVAPMKGVDGEIKIIYGIAGKW